VRDYNVLFNKLGVSFLNMLNVNFRSIQYTSLNFNSYFCRCSYVSLVYNEHKVSNNFKYLRPNNATLYVMLCTDLDNNNNNNNFYYSLHVFEVYNVNRFSQEVCLFQT